MKSIRPILFCPAVFAIAALAPAQTESPSVPPAASETTPATLTPPAPARARALSPALSSALSAGMPRYNPPATTPAKPAEEEEADKPRNGIVHLPRMVVEGNRSPVFEEKDIYTKKGLADLAVKRYLSEFDRGVLNKFTLPLIGTSAEQRALATYYEDERVRKQHEAQDTIAVLEQVDPAAAKSLQNDVNRTFIREN